jgi:hypothetical protein
MTFDKMKETLQNFLNPGDESDDVIDEVEDEVTEETKDDLPWKDDEKPAKSSNYEIKTPVKKSKADKFEALFEEDED